MRILFLAILGSLGLAMLGMPTAPKSGSGNGAGDHARLHAVWVIPDGKHLSLMAVSDDSGDESSGDVDDDSGAPDQDNTAPAQPDPDERSKTFAPNSRIRAYHHHQSIDIDLSDLVIRPV